MKLSDHLNHDEDEKARLPVLYMMLGAGVFILIVIVAVLIANDKGHRRRKTPAQASAEAGQDVASAEDGASDLRADDLDFWDMYREDEPVSDNSVITDKSYEERLKEVEDEEKEKEKEDDLSEGGTKTKVIRPDGTEQWIMINSYIKQNHYREEGFVYKDPVMKYISDGKPASYLGLMLEESDGNVDWALLKDAGIQFVMLRYGYRGYESGSLKKDALFEDLFTGAKNAGLMIGVYFDSAATTQEEAAEEADFLIKGLSDLKQPAQPTQQTDLIQTQNPYPDQTQQSGQGQGTGQEGEDIADTVIVEQIGETVPQDSVPAPEIVPETAVIKNEDVVYPVAIRMSAPMNHTARTDNIPKTMMSLMAKTFTQKVKEMGYTPIVWADKFWLLRRLDLTQLDLNTEIILEQNGEVPDYPYEFSLWQYQNNGKLSGKKSEAKMMISFVDYKSG